MADKKTIAVYDSQVDEYLEFIEQEPVDEILLDFINSLTVGDYVLDLGCGPALSSKVMVDHGLKVDPVDASAEMVSLANQAFNVGARQASFDDIKSRGTYDGIWANFSLLHAARDDFPRILESLHIALKDQGLLHIAMKLGQGAKRDTLDRFYSYYSRQELMSLLQQAGFTVVREDSGEALGLAGDVEPWIAMRCIAEPK